MEWGVSYFKENLNSFSSLFRSFVEDNKSLMHCSNSHNEGLIILNVLVALLNVS